MSEFEGFEEPKEKPVEKQKHKKKQNKVKATAISGVKSGFVLFRFDKRIRKVPVDLWNNKSTQEFDEKQFEQFEKPLFYKGE